MATKFGENREVDFAAAKLMSFGKSFSRMNGQPLDESEVWYNLEELRTFAASNSAYVGMKTVYVDTENNKVYHYGVELDGSLKELGCAPAGDNKTITVAENGTVSLYGVGTLTFTKDVEGIATEVNYQPLLTKNGIVWVEPGVTTVDALNDRVLALETAVGKAAEGDTEATGLFKVIADTTDTLAALDLYIKGKEAADGEDGILGLEDHIEANTAAIEELEEKLGLSEGEEKTVVELIADVEAKIPTDISGLNNDAKYQTDTEVQTAIADAIANINHAVFEKVDTVPDAVDAADNVMYLVPTEDGKHHDIYIKVGENMVLIDDTDADLSSYAKIDDVVAKSDYDEKMLEVDNALSNKLEESDLEPYATTENVNKALENKADNSDIDDILDIIGTAPVYSEKDADGNKTQISTGTGIYSKVYTKEEVADLISSFTGGESAADVLAELNTYKGKNDERVRLVETDVASFAEILYGKEATDESEAIPGIIDDIAALEQLVSDNKSEIDETIETINEKLSNIENNADVNILESVKINGVAIEIKEDKSVNIPVGETTLGVVKGVSADDENAENKISVAEDGTMEVNSININKLVQTSGEFIILNGGNSKVSTDE